MSKAADHPYARREVPEVVTGPTEGIAAADAICDGRIPVSSSWMTFAELQSRHGRSSPAVAAFVRRLAERAAAASVR